MNPNTPGNLLDVLDELLQLPAEQRDARMQCLSLPQADIDRLHRWLSQHGAAEHFLDAAPDVARDAMQLLGDAHDPIHDSDGSKAHSDALMEALNHSAMPFSEAPGTRIGRYKLLQKIGEGGFGVVFMAEQEHPVRRTVALKVIKLGMDTKQVIARFEAERQALAMMDHPNIAKVLDAGSTDTGRPYFVMELVRGVPITEYCDANKLSATERLDLFVRVCGAVQHAHQKGIIHRDLKPSNVLVTMHDDKPVPKVIDFGIAKATQSRLTEKTLFTEFRQMMGTPAYVSPEQAQMSGLDVDTRSDIYSLGVLLYELLTGSTPFDPTQLMEASYHEVQRIIREVEPPKPSTRLSTLAGDKLTALADQRRCDPNRLAQTLRGDLDWIVMKCLEKDHARRYETANGLAMDIERHLNNEPIVARPQSAIYRLRKMIRRNRLAFAAGTAVVFALLIGLSATTVMFVRERQARQRAVVAERNESHQRSQAEGERARAEKATNDAEARKADFRQLLYNTQMNLAAQNAESPAGIPRVQQLIEPWRQDKPDLRSWEWYYLNALSHPALMTLSGDQVPFLSADWSPDGTRLASGDSDGIVRIWDAASGKVLFTFAGHTGSRSFVSDGSMLLGLAWSPDSKRLATSSRDGVLKVWDTASGMEFFTWDEGSHGLRPTLAIPFPVVWSPDGKILAVGQGNQIVIRDTGTGAEIRTLRGHTDSVTQLAWSRDGKQLASGSRDKTIKVWNNPEIGSTVRTLVGHTDYITALGWNPDGTRLASSSKDTSIRIWDMSTGETAARFIPSPGITEGVALAWDPSGQRLVTAGSDRTLKVWDAAMFTKISDPATFTPLFSLSGHKDTIAKVSWSPDGRIASASQDGTVMVWAGAAPGHFRFVGKHTGTASSDRVHALTRSADGKQIISAGTDSMVRVWDVTGSQQIRAFPGSTSVIRSLALHPDGRQLAVGDTTYRIKILDVTTGETLKELPRLSGYVQSLAWSPDGKWLASAAYGSQETVMIWDAGTREASFTSSDDLVQPGSLRWSPDGTRLAATSGSEIKIRRFAAGEKFLTLGRHTGNVTGLAWSPDGTQLASSSHDGTAKIWNSAGGEPIHTLRGHSDQVLGVMWSPDGTRLVTSGRDRTIKIWNPATGQELFSKSTAATGANSPTGVRWSADGMMLDFNLGTEIYVMDATSGYALASLPMPAPTTRPSGGELVQQYLREYLTMQLKYRDEAHPEVVATLGKLAVSLQQSGKLSDAEPFFRQAIALRRKSLGDAHVDTRNAVKDMAGLVIAHLKPMNDAPTAEPMPTMGLGDKGGLALLRRLESEYADNPELLSSFYMGLIGPLMDLGRIDDAKMFSHKLPVLNPGDGAALSKIALRFADSTKPSETDVPLAIELAQAATKSDPTSQFAWFTLGTAHYRNGEFRQAIAAMEKATRYIDASFVQAMAYHQLGETERARTWYTLGCQGSELNAGAVMVRINTRSEASKILGLPEKWPTPDWSPGEDDLRVYRRLTELDPKGAGVTGIATLLGRQAKWADAARVLLVELETCIAALGEDDRDTLVSMNNLAWAYNQSGQYELGLPRAEKAVEKLKQLQLAPDDRALVDSVETLAHLYESMGQQDKAIANFMECLKLAEDKFGPDNLVTLPKMEWLGYAYVDAGRPKDAQDLFEKTLTHRNVLANDVADVLANVNLASTLNGLGWSLLMQGKFIEAEKHLGKALEIRKKQIPDDWARFNTESLLGAALAGQKTNMDEAKSLLLSGYNGIKQREAKIPVPDRKRIKEAAERLVRFYEATDNATEAAKWQRTVATMEPIVRPGAPSGTQPATEP